MKDNFLSNIVPRNYVDLLLVFLFPTALNTDSCAFCRGCRNSYTVLVWENLKPCSVVHLLVLFKHSYNLCSVWCICF